VHPTHTKVVEVCCPIASNHGPQYRKDHNCSNVDQLQLVHASGYHHGAPGRDAAATEDTCTLHETAAIRGVLSALFSADSGRRGDCLTTPCRHRAVVVGLGAKEANRPFPFELWPYLLLQIRRNAHSLHVLGKISLCSGRSTGMPTVWMLTVAIGQSTRFGLLLLWSCSLPQ